MIPYIQVPPLTLFGYQLIQPFGVMVVLAVTFGAWMVRRRAAEEGYDDDEMVTALYWCVGTAFVTSHVFEIVFYQTHKLLEEGPLTLLKVWDGLSSMGGFLGAFLGLAYYYGVRRKQGWLAPAEFIMQGLAFGWIFGRMGCSIVHDHPGHFTDFFLGVRYPDGVRHDLGLYELMFTALVLFPATLLLHRFKPPRGSYIALVCMLYGPARFGMDFLRIAGKSGDTRYFGLTAGHYGSLAIAAVGVGFAIYALLHRDQRYGQGLAAVAATAAASSGGKANGNTANGGNTPGKPPGKKRRRRGKA